MEYGKYIKYAFIAACIGIFLYFAPAILHLLMPFILALIIAIPCHKLVDFLNSKLRIHRGLSSIVIFVIIIAAVCGLIGLLLYYLISQIQSFIEVLPDTVNDVRETIMGLYKEYGHSLPPTIVDFIENYVATYKPPTSQITNSALGYAANFAASIPSALFFALIYLLSLFFFIKDYNKVLDFFRESIPEKVLKILRFIKNTAWSGLVGYIKAQLILSSITALLVSVTFWFLGIEYSVVWGIIVGVIDALPILGSGIILVPYAIISFLSGEGLFFTLCIIILQIVSFVTRQVLSPRIMSSQLGLHPIVTLVSIYIGNELMGVMGMIIFPILALLIVQLYDAYKDAGSFENAIEKYQKDHTEKIIKPLKKIKPNGTKK